MRSTGIAQTRSPVREHWVSNGLLALRGGFRSRLHFTHTQQMVLMCLAPDCQNLGVMIPS